MPADPAITAALRAAEAAPTKAAAIAAFLRALPQWHGPAKTRMIFATEGRWQIEAASIARCDDLDDLAAAVEEAARDV